MKWNWVKTHWLIKSLYSNYIWDIPNQKQQVYLTFDDGPTPEITEWVLAQLKAYDVKASFFCIGDNIRKYPEIFQKTIAEGHAIGNHTFNHLNGWKTATGEYIENTLRGKSIIEEQLAETALFRPPYGKIKAAQAKILQQLGYKIIMWDVISVDYDATVSKEDCLDNVLRNIKPGSIVVFHDSVKAFKNLEYVLPKTLGYLKEKGYRGVKID
jgi:peptidoglycan/xylan/chitin deacetylase (PgdA/CDA1 family)